MSSLKRFVDSKTVNQLLKKGIINKEGVRLLDCTYSVAAKPDWKQYREQLYGKFKYIMALPTVSKQLYMREHLPEAVHLSLDAAMYPGEFERFAMYPPELFQEYIQLLGVNKDEHLILYGRGAFGGMLFSGKLAWLLKSYGHDRVSVMEGGIDNWLKQGYEIQEGEFKLKEKGNWEAEDKVEEFNIKFEELEASSGEEEKKMIERTDKINFLDSRGRGQFNGTDETGLNPYAVSGSYIPGFKNTPLAEMINLDGTVKDKDILSKWLASNGYNKEQPVVTSCNTGMQAALLAYAIEDVEEGLKPRLYNGSLKEMELRDPKRISAGKGHFPA